MESRRSVIMIGSMEVSCQDLEDREVAGTEPASGKKIQPRPETPGGGCFEWTGQKKHKIARDLDNTAGGCFSGESDDTESSRGEEQEQETEGLYWDVEKLNNEILRLTYRKKVQSFEEDDSDEEWVYLNEEQQTALNQRLALCRIRAHEKKFQAMDNEALLKLFPPKVLEDNNYFARYECPFDWYFDPQYCKIACVDDYQRLVLQVTTEFEEMEICPTNHNTLEDDQQFVQFWEKLSRKSKLIELYITERSEKSSECALVKIAEDFPSVYKTLIGTRILDFFSRVKYDYSYAGFLTEMWELCAKKQMKFTDALRCVYDEGKYASRFVWGTKFEENQLAMELNFKPHLERIVAKAKNGADVHQLVMDTIRENFWRRRTYYDYVRKKMLIAEEIGLISKQPPHKLYVPGSYLRCAEATMKTKGGKMVCSAATTKTEGGKMACSAEGGSCA